MLSLLLKAFVLFWAYSAGAVLSHLTRRSSKPGPVPTLLDAILFSVISAGTMYVGRRSGWRGLLLTLAIALPAGYLAQWLQDSARDRHTLAQ